MSAWFWIFSFATSCCCQDASIFEKSNLSLSKATTPCCLQPQFGELRSQSNNRRSHRSVPELLLLPAIPVPLIHSLSIVLVCSDLCVYFYVSFSSSNSSCYCPPSLYSWYIESARPLVHVCSDLSVFSLYMFNFRIPLDITKILCFRHSGFECFGFRVIHKQGFKKFWKLWVLWH